MNLLDIPNDVLELILTKLPIPALACTAQVSRACHELVSSESLWIALGQREGADIFSPDAKLQFKEFHRRFLWTQYHNDRLTVSEDRRTAIIDNGNWNGVLADPLVTQGVRVWAVKVFMSNDASSKYHTYDLGIISDALHVGPELRIQFKSCVSETWLAKSKPAGLALPSATEQNFYSVKLHAKDDTQLIPQLNPSLVWNLPIFFVFRLTLTGEQRRFECWCSNGQDTAWEKLPAGRGYRMVASLSLEGLSMEILSDVRNLREAERYIPDIRERDWFAKRARGDVK